MKINLQNSDWFKIDRNLSYEKVCALLNADSKEIKRYNKLEEINSGDVIFIPEKNTDFYVVKPLDTIATVSQKLGIPQEKLIEKTHSKSLFIGQKIYLN